jgi:hypothetical protein
LGFRCFAVLSCAEKGEFVFGYTELLAHVKDLWSLGAAEISLLARLRVHKSRYRSGELIPLSHLTELTETQLLLAQLFKVPNIRTCVNASEFGRAGLFDHQDLHWYCRLRWYEGIYRAAGELPGTAHSETAKQIELQIANPAPYSFYEKDLVGRLRQLVLQHLTNSLC